MVVACLVANIMDLQAGWKFKIDEVDDHYDDANDFADGYSEEVTFLRGMFHHSKRRG